MDPELLGVALVGLALGLAGCAGPSLTLVAGGDVAFGRVAPSGVARIGGERPLSGVADGLRAADLALVNLESPLAGAPCEGEGIRLVGEPADAAHLAEVGVDVVSLANNHALNCGLAGLERSLAALDDAGVVAIGASRSGPGVAHRVVEARGVTIGLVAATDRLNRGADPSGAGGRVALFRGEALERALQAEVAATRAAGAQVIVVSLHWGVEGSVRPLRAQVALARALIDGGAHVVWGHGPHTLHRVERYGRGVILYSAGNLLFDMRDPVTKRSALYEIRLSEGQGAWRVDDIRARPVQLDSSGRPGWGP